MRIITCKDDMLILLKNENSKMYKYLLKKKDEEANIIIFEEGDNLRVFSCFNMFDINLGILSIRIYKLRKITLDGKLIFELQCCINEKIFYILVMESQLDYELRFYLNSILD